MNERRIPETLEEAYRLRDAADSLSEREFYEEQGYRLRREEYRSRGIRTQISSRRRERQSAIEFSREMFFLEIAEIAGRLSRRPARGAPLRHAPRHPRLPETARLPPLRGRRTIQAQLPGASADGQVPERGLLPLAGDRARS